MLLSEPEEALLAYRANQSLQGTLPGQNKQGRAARCINLWVVSGADVRTDEDFDGIRADGEEISSGTLQRHWRIMWFLFLLGLARMPVCRSFVA